MRRSAMPHESINVDGLIQDYDGLAECLLLLVDFSYCDPKMASTCEKCKIKAQQAGFSDIAWYSYRSWMEQRFPDEFNKPLTPENIQSSYHKFMSFMKEKMPIFDKITGEFQGYYNRKTRTLENTEVDVDKWVAAQWIRKNCRFALKK